MGWCFSILPHFLPTEMVAKWYTAVISVLSVYYVATSTTTGLSLLQEIKNFTEKLNNHKNSLPPAEKKGNKINWVYSNQQSIKQPASEI